MKELNTTYRLCGKTAEYLHWRKKNEVIRRLRATQPVGAGRDGMWRQGAPLPAATTCAHHRAGRPYPKSSGQIGTELFFFQFTIFADFYYFFAFRYFIFQLMRSATHLLCLTRFDLSTDHVIDAFQYFLARVRFRTRLMERYRYLANYQNKKNNKDYFWTFCTF